MKMSKAWPEEKVKEEKIEDAQVWPKNLIDKAVSETMEKSINSLLKETFVEEPQITEEVEEVKAAPKKNVILKTIDKPTLKIESNDKYVWISLGILFFLGFCAYNSVIYKLGIIETLISRRKSVMALK